MNETTEKKTHTSTGVGEDAVVAVVVVVVVVVMVPCGFDNFFGSRMVSVCTRFSFTVEVVSRGGDGLLWYTERKEES